MPGNQEVPSKLQVLQLNANKPSNVLLSLLNDSTLSHYGFLLLTEPWADCHPNNDPYSAPIFHSHRQPFFPSKIRHGKTRNSGCFRSMIWARKDLKCRQVNIKHPDVTAIIYDLAEKNRRIMLVSVYIPCIRNQREKDLQQLITRLSLIRQAYATDKSVDADLELILTGDFNRWDSLWGGNQVAIHGRQGEAEPLVELMAELSLQSLLPRGTVTYSARTVSSTIDLIFTTARLAEEVEQSEVYDCNHGSDHEAIHSSFSTAIPVPLSAPRLIFKMHHGLESVRKSVTARLESLPVLRILTIILSS